MISLYIDQCKKSEQYRGPRRCGCAGAVSVGQGQYRVGRGSIGWAGAVLAVPLPKSDFQHIKKVFQDAFLVGCAQKIDIV